MQRLTRWGVGMAIAAALVTGSTVSAQEPVPTASLVIAGANNFTQYCVVCHGKDAKGTGQLAASLQRKPANLTELTKRNGGTFPRDLVFQVIDGRQPVKGHGGGDMPEWGQAFLASADSANADAVKQRIDSLVEYLATLQVK